MAEVIRLRKVEKVPVRILRDLAEDKEKEWEQIIVIASYKDKNGEWFDCWYNAGGISILTGMLMRAILSLNERTDNE